MAGLLITLGALLLAGLAAEAVGRRTRLPRVTLLIVMGVVIGPAVLDLLPAERIVWYPRLAELALLMVGFLLGGEFTAARLRQYGVAVLAVSVAVTLVTAVVVGAGLWLLGVPVALALLLGAIATATDPAACADVVSEAKAEGAFSRTLLGVVAIDDVWGMLVFTAALTGVGLATGTGVDGVWEGLWEVGGAVGLGVGLGAPMAWLTGRIKPGEPTREEALGMVLLCGGLAEWLEVSYLLAAVVMGAVVANLARHHERPFRAIESIETPFLVLFFVLSGASLQLDALGDVGLVGVAYVVLRVLGRLMGGLLGAAAAGMPVATRRWVGPALLPQAGVALGMALVAAERLPELAALLPVAVLSTVAFELAGPIATRIALARVGEGKSPRG
ncbi:MAG: cation:proton antiporter [Alphaproteobacteria bacterium]|nr:cation:proton antiporter [Alphaproteobacteria bacterium]